MVVVGVPFNWIGDVNLRTNLRVNLKMWINNVDGEGDNKLPIVQGVIYGSNLNGPLSIDIESVTLYN